MKVVVKLFHQQRGLFGAGKVADSLVTDNVWVISSEANFLNCQTLQNSWRCPF